MTKTAIKFLTILFITISMMTILNGQTNPNKGNPTDTYKGLKISVEINKHEFIINEHPKLTVELTNISKEPITIFNRFGWGYSSSFILSLYDANGKEIQPSFLEDDLPAPPFLEKEFQPILSGKSIKIIKDLDFKDLNIKQKGEYGFIVRYRSPISQKLAPPRVKIWSLENGLLQSKKLFFTIVFN